MTYQINYIRCVTCHVMPRHTPFSHIDKNSLKVLNCNNFKTYESSLRKIGIKTRHREKRGIKTQHYEMCETKIKHYKKCMTKVAFLIYACLAVHVRKVFLLAWDIVVLK